jgi:hypothetical protein
MDFNKNISGYLEFIKNIKGNKIPFTLMDTKLHASFPKNSKYFSKVVDKIFAIELEFVQDLLLEIKNKEIRGEIVEFGIFEGAWIERLSAFTNSNGLDHKKIIGFDSFKGLSKPSPEFDNPYWKEGAYAASIEYVSNRLNLSVNPRIHLIEGFFSESLKGGEANLIKEICFARIDCDIYEPTLECLHYLEGRLVDGAILVFDDWSHSIEFGEGKAFYEWYKSQNSLEFEFLCLGVWDHLYLRVLKG